MTMQKWTITDSNNDIIFTSDITQSMFQEVSSLVVYREVAVPPIQLLEFGNEAERLYKIGETFSFGPYTVIRTA